MLARWRQLTRERWGMRGRSWVVVGAAAGAAAGLVVSRRRALASAWTTPRGPVGLVGARVIPMATSSVYPAVAQLLDLKAEDELLEIACGSGEFMAEHATRVRRAVGVDVSKIQVARARERLADHIASGTAQVVHGDAVALPWPDAEFSAVACISSLECIPEPAAALREMRRVLRPGGRAVVTVGSRVYGTETADRGVLGLWVWDEEGARRLVQQAGFGDVSISYSRWGDTGTFFSAGYALLSRLGLVDAEARIVRAVA